MKPVGDSAILIIFGVEIDPAISRRVHSLDRSLSKEKIPGVIETTPSYCALLVHYDPLVQSYGQLLDRLRISLSRMEYDEKGQTRLVEIPTVYGGTRGPDLEALAKQHDLSPSQVIDMHSCAVYRVYMMGFTPGFPYLGGLNPAIATARLQTPRTLVPAGSVGIAGMQTGIYPVDSPGGWQIIGHTPLRLFDKKQYPPSFLSPGDRVRFIPIPEEG